MHGIRSGFSLLISRCGIIRAANIKPGSIGAAICVEKVVERLSLVALLFQPELIRRFAVSTRRSLRSLWTLCTVSSLSASLSGISFFALLAFGDAECKVEHFCCVLTGSCYSDSRILSGL